MKRLIASNLEIDLNKNFQIKKTKQKRKTAGNFVSVVFKSLALLVRYKSFETEMKLNPPLPT